MDLSVYAAWLRGPDISQNIQEIFKKYKKIDYRAFASSRHHYVADNRTARDIQHFGPFWVVKQNSRGGGNAPLAPLIKISLMYVQCIRNLIFPFIGCKHVGEYLHHDTDQCRFLRCDYAPEPWHDSYGKAKLFAREMECAAGSHVPYGFKGDGVKDANPCTGRHSGRCPSEYASLYDHCVDCIMKTAI